MKRWVVIYALSGLLFLSFMSLGRWIDLKNKRQRKERISSPTQSLTSSQSPLLSRLAPPPFTRCTHPALDEISGWVQSKRFPKFYWVHNDSLDRARLFIVNERCTFIKEISIQGALNLDWEDLTLDREGRIYIADSGNNFQWRQDLVIYQVQEPDLSQSILPSSLSVVKKYPYRFPHQTRFPPLDLSKRCLDSEALFKRGEALYLLTKCFSGGQTSIYRLDLKPSKSNSSSPSLLEWVQDLDVGSSLPPYAHRVTGADFDEQTQRLAVVTYQSLHLFTLLPNSSYFKPLTHVLLAPSIFRQVEALAWKGQSTLILANEQRDVFQLTVKNGDIIQSPSP